jgi:hypothetical protein
MASEASCCFHCWCAQSTISSSDWMDPMRTIGPSTDCVAGLLQACSVLQTVQMMSNTVGGCFVLPSNTALLLLHSCLLRNTGEVVSRFHKTNIVRIKPSGDVILNTGVLALRGLACSVPALPSICGASCSKYEDLCCKCCRHLP